jgi:hypothetical protein
VGRADEYPRPLLPSTIQRGVCLVGPNGQGFDANKLNPCQGKGNGALPDTTDAAKKQMLQAALAKAKAGLASDGLATAKSDAAAAQAILKKAM